MRNKLQETVFRTTIPFLLLSLAATTFLQRPDQANAQAANLLANGDFESGNAAPWEGITNAHITEAQVHSGRYAVRMADEEASQGWISVNPGAKYVFTGWFKWVEFAGNDWGYDTFRVINTDWSDAGGVNHLHSKYARDEWHKIAVSFTPNGNRVRVTFGVFGPQETVEMYFDDLQLVEKTGNLPPSIEPSASPTEGSVPLTVAFSANGDDPDGAIQYYYWDFGDGSAGTGPHPSHTYLKRGDYTVTLKAWDNDDALASKSLAITVTDTASPSISITSPTDQSAYSTSSQSLPLAGRASVSGSTIASIVWDNLDTGAAGMVSFTPAAGVDWSTPTIDLKPGTNEILLTATDARGKVDTDVISIYRTISGPHISNLRQTASEVRVYEKYELTFDLDTVAAIPFFRYDENPPPGVEPKAGVTVEGVFTAPSGKVLRQPAFFMTEVIRRVSGGKVHYDETNTTYWVVRFSPQEVGRYRVALSARDASGETNLSAGEFNALPPTRQGFIRVSRADPRYFEFSNGDLYWPIGPAWGLDYAKFNGTGLNFERPWMGGRGAYSTNWARWMSTANRLGNEGYDSQLSFREHYPSHELSQEIFYPEGRRLWLSCWGSEQFCFTIKPDTEYLIKIRLKTEDIQGPVDSAYPYGFMIKTHEWPTDTLERDLRPYPSLIPVISANLDWHTVLVRYRATERDTHGHISLFLDNVSSGRVYIDEFSLREILPDGSLGGEQIRDFRADLHTYVGQRPAAYFDWQVEQGEQNGVFFKYVVMDKRDWVPNHLLDVGVFYNFGHGYYQPDGTKARWLLQQWWRYLIARWGYSTAVHSWELNNEGPPDDGSGEHARAAQDFARFMHENDAHPHLATTSFWCCWRPTFWGDHDNFPDVDYADVHKYTNLDKLQDGSLAAYDMAAFESQDSLTFADDDVGKPVLRAETGITSPGEKIFDYLSQPNPGIWYHNLLWAQLNSGGMSDPNYWWPQHINKIDQGAISQPFYLFLRGLDLNQGGYVDLAASVGNPRLRALGQKNLTKDKALLWIQNRDHTWRNVMGVDSPTPISPQSGTVAFALNPNAEYAVQWWDTYRGDVVQSETISTGASGELTLSVSNLGDDVAVKVTRSGAPQPTFTDVPLDHPYYNEIEALYRAGYTAGCGTDPLRYCPDQAMTRAESAVFVERGIHGVDVSPPQPTEERFADLPLGSWAAKWAEVLYTDGYTAGCGTDPLRYCPWQGHTRTEGAVFYLRMLRGEGYLPPAPSGVFADVPLEWWGAKWAEEGYRAGLIPACGQDPLRFCPNDPLSRGLAAYMMVQAKGLEGP